MIVVHRNVDIWESLTALLAKLLQNTGIVHRAYKKLQNAYNYWWLLHVHV